MFSCLCENKNIGFGWKFGTCGSFNFVKIWMVSFNFMVSLSKRDFPKIAMRVILRVIFRVKDCKVVTAARLA